MELLQVIKELMEKIHELKNIYYPKFDLKVGYLTLFSQSITHYEELVSKLGELGKKQDANNGVKFILNEPLSISSETIEIIRVRKPDVHRPELGCCDLIYRDEDYIDLRKIALEKGLDIILRKEYEMIELSSFNLAVYAYLVKDL